MSRRGWTLIELLAGIFVMTAAMLTFNFVGGAYGAWWGTAAGLVAGLLSAMLVIFFYRWSWRRDQHRLEELREEYRAIYRVAAVPSHPEIIIMAEGAEIRCGDYGWEAGPPRNDGLIYLQGLTREWSVVWHAGFCADEIERVATKPNSQYDSWHPYWADPPPLPPCPYPVVERETMTIGRPHHSHHYFVLPTLYRP